MKSTLSLGTAAGRSRILLRLCSCKMNKEDNNNDHHHLRELIPISYLYVIVHEATCISKIRVFGVDVSQLNGNQVVDLRRNFNKSMNQTKHR